MYVKTLISTFIRAVVLCGAFIPVLAPSAAFALVTTPVTPIGPTTNYDATFEAIPGPSAPYSGRLQIAISDKGVVDGYFRPANNDNFVPVTGGRDGDHIWLTIGNRMNFHIDAQFEGDGKMVGGATNYGPVQYKFVAVKDDQDQ